MWTRIRGKFFKERALIRLTSSLALRLLRLSGGLVGLGSRLGCRLSSSGLAGLVCLLGSLLLLLALGGLLFRFLGLGLFDVTQLFGFTSNTLLLVVSVLGSSGLTLVSDVLLTGSVALHLVDGLNEHVLVLELVTLGGQVQLVVDVLVDLLGVTVLLQKTSENTLSAHPENVGGHTSITGTLSLTMALVATLTIVMLCVCLPLR